ncbi:MAG: acyltransferase [Nitrospira sp.]|nr:acyltransferase [Nitrospira sp.]
MQNEPTRLIPLEACRGIAAFIVLIEHYFLAFSPLTTGTDPHARTAESLIGQPYFALFNGTGAVAFFFTLSGFVLSWSYFHHETRRHLLSAVLKRLPRLAGTVTVTTIVSYGLFKLGLYYFEGAAQLSSSLWLARFGGGTWTPDFQPSFVTALFQGLTTFFTGQADYNTNLWTMKAEFFGSMLVYMLACFIAIILRYRHFSYTFIIFSLLALSYDRHLFPFVVGVYLASSLARKTVEISTPTAIVLITSGLYLLGFMAPEKAYAWVNWLPGIGQGVFQTGFHTLGSIIIIFATMANKTVFRNLNRRFFKFVGQMSFPLYLVHALVLCSISSYAYLHLTHSKLDAHVTLIAVFAITVFVSIGASLPLHRFDQWWVKEVQCRTNQFLELYHKESAEEPSAKLLAAGETGVKTGGTTNPGTQ